MPKKTKKTKDTENATGVDHADPMAPCGKAAKAGISFSPAHVLNIAKTRTRARGRVREVLALFLAGKYDHIGGEMHTVIEKMTLADKKKRVQVADVCRAIRGDEELHRFFSGIKIYNGTRNPDIHKIIKPMRKSAAEDAQEA